jgi:hypothetical protein
MSLRLIYRDYLDDHPDEVDGIYTEDAKICREVGAQGVCERDRVVEQVIARRMDASESGRAIAAFVARTLGVRA